MIRTQIYISKPVHKELHRIAQVKDKPMAEVVRTYIEEGLQKERERINTGIRALEQLVTMSVEGEPRDLSTNLDYYLYGGTKKSK